MKRKKSLVIAALLVLLLGCILFGGVMHMFQWDFSKLSTISYEINEYTINEKYKDITIDTDTADIVFLPAENENTAVVCNEEKNAKHSVAVQDGALTIRLEDERKWFEHIGISFRDPKITVYVPAGEYGALSIKNDTGDVEIPKELTFASVDIAGSTGNVANYASATDTVKIKTSTGDIRVENISAGALELSVSTGRVSVRNVTCQGDVQICVTTGRTGLTDLRCKNLISHGDTGDISLTNVIAEEKCSIERSTGDVHFEGCDAAEITVKTDTGHVKGSLLSEKVFFAQTDTGKIDVPKTTAGGKCEITTDTGNIQIDIE